MRAAKKKKLEDKGWVSGDAADFLQLTPEEAAFVELKVKLTEALLKRRRLRKWTQTQLALRIKSSQSRVAKIESGDPSVSLDLVFRSLFALGVTQKEVARIIDKSKRRTRRNRPVPA